MKYLALFAAVALATGCSSTPVLQSAPAASPPAIDGSEADWAGVLQPVEGHSRLSLGTHHDAGALYAVAVLQDAGQVRGALAGGLTLWLDPEGGKDRVLGVRFPIGLGAGERPGGPRGEDRQPGAVDERFAAATRDLEVLHDGADAGARAPASEPGSIQAAATLTDGVLVVEYRIPWDAADGLLMDGDAVGLGLTTPEMTRPEGADRPRGGRGSAGGAMRGGPGGRGGAQPGGARPPRLDRPESMDVWVRVDLSSTTD